MSAPAGFPSPGPPGQPGQPGSPGPRSPGPPRPPPQHAAVRADRVYLGWQYAPMHADPGPLPRRPAPPATEQVNPGWIAAQRREERRLSRPLKMLCATSAALAGLLLALGLTGLLNYSLTGVGVAVCLAAAAVAGRAVWRNGQDLGQQLAGEEQRVEKIREVQRSRLAARQEQHAWQVRAWEERRAAFDRQLQWYAVSLPAEIDRVDLVGGTLPGWSALLTMIAAPRLAAGGDVTVLDLTEGAVAGDLLAVAGRSGIEPLVWVLPGDLPRLDLDTGLDADTRADVLAATVAAGEQGASAGGTAASAPADNTILHRILGVLGPEAGIAQITAALRVLAQVGDPREDLQAGLLTADQVDRVMGLFGRAAADRVVIERAWAIESRLRRLDRLGSAPGPLPPSRLRVACLDRRVGALGNKVLGTYLTVALTHVLRQASPGPRWRHTVCLLGAEKLGADVLDRLLEACEISGTGLLVGYRSIPAHVKERLGRGDAAIAFMRLGNADDARVASEQIGTEHRFLVSQLTDTVGTSVTDTAGYSYTSTVGTADSVADSASVSDSYGSQSGRGRTRQDAFAPFGHVTGSQSKDASESHGTSDSRSITVGISSSTAWGISTSTAVGASSSVARTSQRSREFLVEQHELQRLPPSAVIVTYASPGGRRVVFADANPGIIALPTATLSSLDETVSPEAAVPGSVAAAGAGLRAGEAPGDEPPPNLGPPPERLDWRRPR
ncbi:MAG TPA: hypothetical protein VMC83_38295 [Streptosporangiaceae bacterium]|nr:hypothetical protein [Streptosporangiaceae bacterium]